MKHDKARLSNSLKPTCVSLRRKKLKVFESHMIQDDSKHSFLVLHQVCLNGKGLRGSGRSFESLVQKLCFQGPLLLQDILDAIGQAGDIRIGFIDSGPIASGHLQLNSAPGKADLAPTDAGFKDEAVPDTGDKFAHVRQVHQDQLALTHVGQQAGCCRLQHV